VKTPRNLPITGLATGVVDTYGRGSPVGCRVAGAQVDGLILERNRIRSFAQNNLEIHRTGAVRGVGVRPLDNKTAAAGGAETLVINSAGPGRRESQIRPEGQDRRKV